LGGEFADPAWDGRVHALFDLAGEAVQFQFGAQKERAQGFEQLDQMGR